MRTSRRSGLVWTLSALAIAAVVGLTVIGDKSVSPTITPRSDAPAQTVASPTATISSTETVEEKRSGEITTPVLVANQAAAFNAFMEAGVENGGTALIQAFDIHDSCGGVPRSQNSLDQWYEEIADVADIDYELMQRRTRECIGVPNLTFDTRRRLLLPLAKAGDMHAQFLLATSFPYEMEAHRDWLRKSAQNGYSQAMVLLAQSLVSDTEAEYARPKAYRLLTEAAGLGHPFADSERAALEQQMSIGEIRMAQNDSIPDSEYATTDEKD